MGTPIGELQGIWAAGAKFALATYPAVIAWAAYITVSVMELKGFQAYGSRFTAEDGVQLYKEFDTRLDAFEREFTRDFVRKDEVDGLRP